MTLEDMVVVITGASRGIGRALAIGFAQEGATVVAAARTLGPAGSAPEGSLEETAGAIRDAGGRAVVVRCDVAYEADVRALAEETVAKAGPADVLINNAGISRQASITKLSVEDFDRVVAVNFRGAFLACKYFVPGMMERKRGSIINISSRIADWEAQEDIISGSIRAATNRFTKNLAADMRPYNVAVNALSPGLVATEITRTWDVSKYGREIRMDQPEDVVPAALWLARQDASTFTGHFVLKDDFGKTWP